VLLDIAQQPLTCRGPVGHCIIGSGLKQSRISCPSPAAECIEKRQGARRRIRLIACASTDRHPVATTPFASNRHPVLSNVLPRG
jgi:hypothetical protein